MRHPSDEITAYLRGELSGEAKRAVSDHLIDCGSCREEFLALKKTREALAYVPELETSPAFAASVMAACRELSLEETRADLAMEVPERLSFHIFLPWAALGLPILLLVGAWLLNREPSSPIPVVAVHPDDSESSPEPIPEAGEPYLPMEIGEDPEEELEPLPAMEDTSREPAVILSFDEAVPTPAARIPDLLPPPLPSQPIPAIPPWSPPLEEPPKVSEDVGSYGRRDPSTPPKDNFWLLAFVSADGSLPEHFVSPSGAFAAVVVPRVLELRMAQAPTSESGHALGATLGKLMEQDFRGGLGNTLHHHALITYHLALLRAPALRAQLETAVGYLLKRQNKDGGFGFQEGAPSNALVSGWAALALMEARDQGMGQCVNPLARIRRYFQRLMDPRTGICGYAARGDLREPGLSTALAHLIDMDHRSPAVLQRREARAWELAIRDVRSQEKHATAYLDLDALMAFKILAVRTGRLESWRTLSGPLLATASQHLPQGRFESWTPFARGLWVELLR